MSARQEHAIIILYKGSMAGELKALDAQTFREFFTRLYILKTDVKCPKCKKIDNMHLAVSKQTSLVSTGSFVYNFSRTPAGAHAYNYICVRGVRKTIDRLEHVTL